MNVITWIHIAGGMIALAAGASAAAVRKGGSMHAKAGACFCMSMLVLGITASILAPFKTPPDSPLGGVMVCYFVATAWVTARHRTGVPGTFEKIACATVLLIAVATIGQALSAVSTEAPSAEPPGPGVLFVFGAICLVSGLSDLRFILHGKLSGVQRIARHVWRVCFAFFIATGSSFLGQQDVMPQAVRGAPILFVFALAPIALMLFWLTRVRFFAGGRLRPIHPAGHTLK